MASPFPSLAPDDFSGRKLGKYEIVCRLSTGGMSEIFLAFQRGVGGFRKSCVLKQILSSIKGEEEFVRMFLNEAKITAAFNHPNIAHVFDLDTADGELFLSMEFVPGATLVEVARACKMANEPIPIGFTLAAVRDTALALHYAHTFRDPLGNLQPVIHRDIAEKNIMVTYEGVTKLLDFGIAKSLTASSRTQVGMVKGTSGYMSPEQVLGQKLDGRSDIFSLGVVLHECLTGIRLFHSKRPEDGMTLPLRESVAPPSRTNPDISKAVDEITLKALRRDREERFPTALEMARALENAAGKLIWRPEQAADLIGRLFAERREQTRQLLSATVEATGEGYLPLLEKPPPKRSTPTPRPVSATASLPAEPVTDPHDARELLKNLPSGPTNPAWASPSSGETQIAVNPWDLPRSGAASAKPPALPTRSRTELPKEVIRPFPSTELFAQRPQKRAGRFWALAAAGLALAVGVAGLSWVLWPAPTQGQAEAPGDASGSRPTEGPEAAPQPTQAPPEAVPGALGEKTGSLTLVTTPWAKVLLDGRSLGNTPLFRAPVPAGKHRLTLVGPSKDLHYLEVEIDPDALTAVKAELSSLQGK